MSTARFDVDAFLDGLGRHADLDHRHQGLFLDRFRGAVVFRGVRVASQAVLRGPDRPIVQGWPPAFFHLVRIVLELFQEGRFRFVVRHVRPLVRLRLEDLVLNLERIGHVLIGKLIHGPPQQRPVHAVVLAGKAVGPFRLLHLQLLHVFLGNVGVSQQPARHGHLLIGQVLRLPGIQIETSRDEEQNARPKQEPAFPLQAGFAQQTFEGPVRHSG